MYRIFGLPLKADKEEEILAENLIKCLRLSLDLRH